MGEAPGSSVQLTRPKESSDASIEREMATLEAATIEEAFPRSELDAGRRRFTWAALIAIGLTAVPFVWILWSDWGPASPLRDTTFEGNYFDLQARAMFHGHLYLANGAIGLEGFVHGGHTYTYFGLFPSIIRMPVLLVTSSLDGRLTAPYMLLAWLLTGLFSSLLLWRVRYLVRGDSAMGRAEATAYGVLIATLMGGTIWMLLASIPFVFNEDIAWSICLTVGSIFALLGVVERPSWARVVASGVLILCANLDRATTGWACAVAAGLISLWFLLGLGGRDNRRWFVPVLAAGLIPVIISCVVNYAKFGVLFGVSNAEQVWTHLNAYRRKFLAANHNAEEGTIFVPTNLVTYFRPDGLSFSRVFPFITLPTSPPTALGGVLFDRLYRTTSLPASTPLLFLLSIWGLVTAFRPKAIGKVARTRLLLLAAGGAAAALMLWGYIAPRYLGDFVPFLVLASAVGVADIFRRLEGRRRSVRSVALGVMAVVAVFSITANVGMAIVPNEEWNTTQVLNYVQGQKTLSDLTGHPLEANVVHGSSLPDWGPAGQLYVIGDCDGLYVSNGENYSTVPSEQYNRTTWMTVQLGPTFQHNFYVMAKSPPSGRGESVTLISVGKDRLTIDAMPSKQPNRVLLSFSLESRAGLVQGGPWYDVNSEIAHVVTVTTDAPKHQFAASIDGLSILTRSMAMEPIHAESSSTAAQGAPGVLQVKPEFSPRPALCESLAH